MSNEYSNSKVGPACSYKTLSNYNGSSPGTMVTPRANSTSGYYVVPTYEAPGYDTLTNPHGGSGNCNGFFSIDSAYGSGAANCNQQYTKMLCN